MRFRPRIIPAKDKRCRLDLKLGFRWSLQIRLLHDRQKNVSTPMMSAQGSSKIRFTHLLATVSIGTLLCFLGSDGYQLKAHPISLSTVVANVETNRVKVELKILVEDLMLFQKLQPNLEQILSAEALKSGSEKHQQFLIDYFQIRTVDGVPLPGTVTKTDTSEIPETGVAVDAVMSTSIYYELDFPLESSPDFLTFSQNFGGPSNPLPSVMDLIVLQNSARLGYPVQISPKNPHSVEFDWEKPPINDRKSWRQRREMMKQRREELLGITSYSTTYSYIYITESEIRHEILVPLLTLETWFPIERRNADFLEVDEQDAATDAVDSYFQDHGLVSVDGISVPAKIDRVDFYGLDFRDFAQRTERKRVGIHNARAGIILSYPAKQAPQSVDLTWETFNNHTPLLNSVVYDHKEPGYRHFFTPAEPSFTWQKTAIQGEPKTSTQLPRPKEQPVIKISMVSAGMFLVSFIVMARASARRSRRLGLVSVGIAIVAAVLLPQNLAAIAIPKDRPAEQIIPNEEADQVFSALHSNIYRAFDYGQDSQVYDVLDQSVGGELLETLYLKISEGLRMEEQGGAIARVSSTSIESKEIVDRSYTLRKPQFTCQCVWNVAGTVEHWGHIHTRENQYEGQFTVSVVDNTWKITGLEVKNETRVAFQTGLRETK